MSSHHLYSHKHTHTHKTPPHSFFSYLFHLSQIWKTLNKNRMKKRNNKNSCSRDELCAKEMVDEWKRKETHTGKSKQVCFVSIVTSTVIIASCRHHHLSVFVCTILASFFSHKFLLFTSQKKVREMQVDSGKTVHLGAHRIQYFKKVLCFCEAKSGKEAKKKEETWMKTRIYCF